MSRDIKAARKPRYVWCPRRRAWVLLVTDGDAFVGAPLLLPARPQFRLVR